MSNNNVVKRKRDDDEDDTLDLSLEERKLRKRRFDIKDNTVRFVDSNVTPSAPGFTGLVPGAIIEQAFSTTFYPAGFITNNFSSSTGIFWAPLQGTGSTIVIAYLAPALSVSSFASVNVRSESYGVNVPACVRTYKDVMLPADPTVQGVVVSSGNDMSYPRSSAGRIVSGRLDVQANQVSSNLTTISGVAGCGLVQSTEGLMDFSRSQVVGSSGFCKDTIPGITITDGFSMIFPPMIPDLRLSDRNASGAPASGLALDTKQLTSQSNNIYFVSHCCIADPSIPCANLRLASDVPWGVVPSISVTCPTAIALPFNARCRILHIWGTVGPTGFRISDTELQSQSGIIGPAEAPYWIFSPTKGRDTRLGMWIGAFIVFDTYTLTGIPSAQSINNASATFWIAECDVMRMSVAFLARLDQVLGQVPLSLSGKIQSQVWTSNAGGVNNNIMPFALKSTPLDAFSTPDKQYAAAAAFFSNDPDAVSAVQPMRRCYDV